MPYSVDHCSPLVLDVVLSTSAHPTLANPAKFDPVGGQTNVPAGVPINDRVTVAFESTQPIPETPVSDIDLVDTSPSPFSVAGAAPKVTLFQEIVTHATRKARESDAEQRLISLLALKAKKLFELRRTSTKRLPRLSRAVMGSLVKQSLGKN